MARTSFCASCNKPKCPFITIITRCYKRPEKLQKNIRSIKAQTDPDYEQVFIFDKEGHGLAAADQALNKYKEINCGNYIMVLDDDDMVIDNEFIAKIKKRAEETSPDVIIWRGKFFGGKEILPPKNELWGVRPVVAQIGSFSYCTTHELYSKYIHACKDGNCGDFHFINKVYHSKEKPKVEWIDEIFVSCQGTPNFGMYETSTYVTTDNETLQVFEGKPTKPGGRQRRILRRT